MTRAGTAAKPFTLVIGFLCVRLHRRTGALGRVGAVRPDRRRAKDFDISSDRAFAPNNDIE